MPDLPPARALLSEAPETTYEVGIRGDDERLLRRKRLVTAQGEGFLVDLPNVTNLDDHWGFLLEDGRAIQVLPAEEALVEITGQDLHRLAWHIGNRHTPCQIEATRLLIRRDHVLEAMLAQLGAKVAFVHEPFTPEGGAYGTGRTMGHDHGGHSYGPDTNETTPPAPDSHAHDETFGWHDHGDGKLHFHATKR
jgi:urease accessory protein